MPAFCRDTSRRLLSLWFPRLSVDRICRLETGLCDAPLAVVRESGNLRVLSSVSPEAQAQGLFLGQPLQDALSLCSDVVTRLEDPRRDAAFLTALRRWAGKFSPWVSEQGQAGLMIDLTGCAHLFGGEAELLEVVEADCVDLGLEVSCGIADTAGAAWALARYAGRELAATGPNGDAIDQEARATRSRASKRRNWERGGSAPRVMTALQVAGRISPSGRVRDSIAKLPVAALRLDDAAIAALARLGLRRIDDLYGMPRAALARRFGQHLVRRLDQALGLEPEPISPARAPLHFAARLSFPEPIGLEDDIMAGLDRLLPVVCEKLRGKGRGARGFRLELRRADGGGQQVEIGLARPADTADRVRSLFALKIGVVDPGFGIDLLRLEALQTEPVHAVQHRGGHEAAAERGRSTALDDLIGRIGARVGLEAITRQHPAASHVPEKTSKTLAAAWSDPAEEPWPRGSRPRPMVLFRSEPLTAAPDPHLPTEFRWRGRDFQILSAMGPERIAPEWWLDDPEWRTGVRDYWRVDTDRGHRLWIYYAHGGITSAGWFAQGDFG